MPLFTYSATAFILPITIISSTTGIMLLKFTSSKSKLQKRISQPLTSLLGHLAIDLALPDTCELVGFAKFDTPVAGLNTQRQVHFPARPASVAGQQDGEEAQPKRTFTTLRRPMGQPKGIVGKTLSIHQQILPTGFKPINRSLFFFSAPELSLFLSHLI